MKTEKKNSIVRLFRLYLVDRKLNKLQKTIDKTREDLSYLKSRCEGLQTVCMGRHYHSEEIELVNIVADLSKYTTRLNNLLDRKQELQAKFLKVLETLDT